MKTQKHNIGKINKIKTTPSQISKKKKPQNASQPFQTNYELPQLCFSLMNHEEEPTWQPRHPPTLQDPPAVRNHQWLRTKNYLKKKKISSSLSSCGETQAKFKI
jgi:hypothetical protein